MLASVIALCLLACGCGGANKFSPQKSASVAPGCQKMAGGIIRGPVDERRLAIVFTGHGFAEGADTILDELARHHGHGSFFVTGMFLTNREFAPVIRRMISEGHYLGPHSDRHLLYCDWPDLKHTLVTREVFEADLKNNFQKLPKAARKNPRRFFLPAFEQYNSEIVDWSAAEGFTLINFTPGTRSNADYTGEADKNFVSSQKIFDSILKREREDPHGLNGFILLLHLGSGPGRTDKFAARFGELLDRLAEENYQFVRVDELLLESSR